MGKQGVRPLVFSDELDIKICNALKNKDLSIMELKDIVKVAHKHLAKRIEKLEKEKVIIRDDSPKGRKIILRLNPKYKTAYFRLTAHFDGDLGLGRILDYITYLQEKKK